MLKVKFQEVELAKFWIELSTEYPDISTNALKVIMCFPTTYLCERTFLLYAATKTKFRNGLDIKPDLQVRVTFITPNMEVLCDQQQAHPSHKKRYVYFSFS